MPGERVPMKKIVEVLRLKHEAKLSHAQIARACGLSKGAVSKYVSLAQAKGLSWPLPEGTDQRRLEALLYPAQRPPERFAEPDYFQIHQQLKRKGVTLQLLWSEYAAVHDERAYRYSQYCHRYRRWRARQRRSMHQLHRAGEKAFIDYCGTTVEVIDPDTGELHRAQIFVGVLGASSYTFAEATWSQSLADWIGSNQRMLRFFGGVPALLVPDNLKAAVTRANRYTPQVNDTYAEMAAHYHSAVLPARPYKPKDKAKAEAAVQLVERWILARLRHQRFFSLAQLNQAISALLVDLNERPFQGRTESRRDLFEAIDRPALKPLPADAYEFAEWHKAKPGIDYHVAFEGRLYSVPHALVGQTLELRVTATAVEILHKGQRVAVHARRGKGRYATITEHMPKSHQAHREWSPGRFQRWAAAIGPATAALVRFQLQDRPHPEHGYRACLGLLNLARRYSQPRLEAACARALALGAPRYKSVASMLKQGLDQQPLPDDSEAQDELPVHTNVRGAGYYH
ncbi:IS21 family transposase [Halorhodospira halophila]|uniref:IS21 family transposase n=1 Tax=Halorhodospira halophila TaxID=1053 RepID=UPI00191391D8|nr:IS21 family transposase [Halorhodospira halophila]